MWAIKILSRVIRFLIFLIRDKMKKFELMNKPQKEHPFDIKGSKSMITRHTRYLPGGLQLRKPAKVLFPKHCYALFFPITFDHYITLSRAISSLPLCGRDHAC